MSTDALQVPQTLAGRCMCGAVHYTISEKSLADGLCHCDRCRPQSGSAFSTVIFIHRSALTITGETAVFDDVGSSGLRVLRRYCPRCGSPLTTEPDLTPELFMVKAGTPDSTNGSIRCGSCSPAGADLGSARSPAPNNLMAILRSR
jgi:hypothetical protein